MASKNANASAAATAAVGRPATRSRKNSARSKSNSRTYSIRTNRSSAKSAITSSMAAANGCALCSSCWSIEPAAVATAKLIDAIDAAIALELIHSATLLHDDIIDGGMLRRGKPSAFARYGHAAVAGRRRFSLLPRVRIVRPLRGAAGADRRAGLYPAHRRRGDGRPDAP